MHLKINTLLTWIHVHHSERLPFRGAATTMLDDEPYLLNAKPTFLFFYRNLSFIPNRSDPSEWQPSTVDLYISLLSPTNSNNNSNSSDNVYGAVIIAVNCHCESSPGSSGQSSTSARWLPTFRPDRSI